MRKASTGLSPRIAGLLYVGLSILLAAGIGCGGGSDPVSGPQLSCSDGGPVAANTVGLQCGGKTGTSGDISYVRVVLGRPTSGTTNFRGFAFDIVYDNTKLQFVPDPDDVAYKEKESSDLNVAPFTPVTDPPSQRPLIAVKLGTSGQGRLLVGIVSDPTLVQIRNRSERFPVGITGQAS